MVASTAPFPYICVEMWRMLTHAIKSCPGTTSQSGLKFVRIFTLVRTGHGLLLLLLLPARAAGAAGAGAVPVAHYPFAWVRGCMTRARAVAAAVALVVNFL